MGGAHAALNQSEQFVCLTHVCLPQQNIFVNFILFIYVIQIAKLNITFVQVQKYYIQKRALQNVT